MKIMKSLILGIAILTAVPAFADDMRREIVRFAPGSSSSTIKASVKGYQTVQYAVCHRRPEDERPTRFPQYEPLFQRHGAGRRCCDVQQIDRWQQHEHHNPVQRQVLLVSAQK